MTNSISISYEIKVNKQNQASVLRKISNIFPTSVKLNLPEIYSTFTPHLYIYIYILAGGGLMWFTEKQKNKDLICFFLQAKLQFVLIRAAGLQSLP